VSGGRVTGRALARAALLGNPSDGFGGKTIAVTLEARAAEISLEPAGDGISVDDPDATALVEAAVSRLERDLGAPLPIGLSVTLRTEIPRQVGLGGSSAIVIAALRALCRLRDIHLTPDRLAELALAVEVEDIGIAAGPQDRLVQAHEGLLYMDFDPQAEVTCERLARELLPPIFVAHRTESAAPSGDVHAELRRRFAAGEPAVRSRMREIAALAEAGRECLLAGDHESFGSLMRENVAARGRMVALDPRDLRLVEIARDAGAPANYAGSGGAIVGLVPAGRRDDVRAAFAGEGCETVFPA
jgi:glucuronokinase